MQNVRFLHLGQGNTSFCSLYLLERHSHWFYLHLDLLEYQKHDLFLYNHYIFLCLDINRDNRKP